MTTVLKIAAVAAALSALAPAAFAQATNSASANASATIIAPVTVTKDTDLVFGTIVRSTGGGSVVIGNSANATRNASGVTTLGTTFSPAKFTVSGDAGRAYSVSYSQLSQLNGPSGATMPIQLNPSVNGASTLNNGSDTIYVGATLTVSGNQAAGAYNGSFTATVNYQ